MQIDIQACGVTLSEPLTTRIKQRLLFALGRFQAHIVRVSVHLSAPGDPLCHLQVHLHGLPDIVIEDSEGDLGVAIDRAAERAGRTLGRQLQRAGQAFDTHPDREEQ